MSKAEEELYNAVKSGVIYKVTGALKNGAKNEYRDNTGWTALDLAAFNVNHSICEVILTKVPYQWTSFETKTPFEKLITKNINCLSMQKII